MPHYSPLYPLCNLPIPTIEDRAIVSDVEGGMHPTIELCSHDGTVVASYVSGSVRLLNLGGTVTASWHLLAEEMIMLRALALDASCITHFRVRVDLSDP